MTQVSLHSINFVELEAFDSKYPIADTGKSPYGAASCAEVRYPSKHVFSFIPESANVLAAITIYRGSDIRADP